MASGVSICSHRTHKLEITNMFLKQRDCDCTVNTAILYTLGLLPQLVSFFFSPWHTFSSFSTPLPWQLICSQSLLMCSYISGHNFAGEFYQTFRELIPILLKLFNWRRNGSKLILWSHHYPDTKTRYRHHKKITLQANILDKHRCKIFSTKY